MAWLAGNGCWGVRLNPEHWAAWALEQATISSLLKDRTHSRRKILPLFWDVVFSVSLPCVPVQLHPSATPSRDSVSCLPLNYLPALECSWELPSCPACMWCLWPGLGSFCLFGSHFADWVIFTAPNRISKTHFCQVVCLFYPWDWKE